MGVTLRELEVELAKWRDMSVSQRVQTHRSLRNHYYNRGANGFPEPIGKKFENRTGPPSDMWDFNEVLMWYLEWKPAKASSIFDNEKVCNGCGRPMPGMQRSPEPAPRDHSS